MNMPEKGLENNFGVPATVETEPAAFVVESAPVVDASKSTITAASPLLKEGEILPVVPTQDQSVEPAAVTVTAETPPFSLENDGELIIREVRKDVKRGDRGLHELASLLRNRSDGL